MFHDNNNTPDPRRNKIIKMESLCYKNFICSLKFVFIGCMFGALVYQGYNCWEKFSAKKIIEEISTEHWVSWRMRKIFHDFEFNPLLVKPLM